MDKRLAFLLKNSNDILCVTDIHGNIVSVNHSWELCTGYTADESKSRNLTGLSHPDDRQKITELYSSIISIYDIEDVRIRLESAEGRYLTINWSFCFDSVKQLIYGVGIYTNENLNVRNPYNISDKVQHVLATLNEGFFMLDASWRINAFNPAFQKLAGTSAEDLFGADFRMIDKLMLAGQVIPELESVYKTGKASRLQYYDSYWKGWLRLNIYWYKGELIVFIRDISNIKIEQLILTLEKSVLQHNFLPGYPLSKIADELLAGIEEIFPEMYCSILEVDAAQERIYHLSAPRLPAAYNDAINGKMIGPKAGSCGTAAYQRRRVIVNDIANSPLWDEYKQFILPYGFKACWSTPVISAQNTDVLATFAVYYNSIREPGKEELRVIDRTINILRILIESKRNDTRIAEQTRRLQEIAAISSHNIRRPVATILGLVNLFDKNNLANPLNSEIIEHLETSAVELDDVIHIIVEKTANM